MSTPQSRQVLDRAMRLSNMIKQEISSFVQVYSMEEQTTHLIFSTLSILIVDAFVTAESKSPHDRIELFNEFIKVCKEDIKHGLRTKVN